ncbi:MAG: hypothetical protein M3Q85_12270 [Acidobacteriota bacterium]|nr:hypothetical protein [Acidobacteriota bacterium]
MRARNVRPMGLFMIACLLSGCANNPAPRAWRLAPAEAQRTARGGWIVLEPLKSSGGDPTGEPRIEGELIAADGDVFHILTASGLRSVLRDLPHRITVVGYRTASGALAGWAAAGAASTLSHGVYLIFTAPMWIISGFVAAHREGRAGVFHDDDVARLFARFPQGVPAGVNVEALGALVANPSAGPPR